MAATLLWFSGAETGNINEFPDGPQTVILGGGSIVTTPVRTGTYSLETQSGKVAKVKLAENGATSFFRGYFKIGANPSVAQVIVGLSSSGGAFDKFQVWLNADGTVGWSFGSLPAGPTASGADAVSLSGWNFLEVKYVRDASVGGMEIYLNGVLQVSSFATNTTSGTSATTACIWLGDVEGLGGGQTIHWDDLAYGTGAYIGAGQSVAVQGKAGTPTYDAWTKVGAADAFGAWSQTPFDASKSCTDVLSGDKQTMLVDDAALGAAISAGDTINGAAVVAVAKCATTFSTIKILRRVAGADTVSATRSTSTVDGFIPRGANGETFDVFTDTLANLQGAEIGAQDNSSTDLATVEDMWLLVDYTPLPPVNITPPAGALTLTGYAPTVPGNEQITPAAGALALAGAAPSMRVSSAIVAGPVLLAIRYAVARALSVAMPVRFDVAEALPTLASLPVAFNVREALPALEVRYSVIPDLPGTFLDSDIQRPVSEMEKTP